MSSVFRQYFLKVPLAPTWLILRVERAPKNAMFCSMFSKSAYKRLLGLFFWKVCLRRWKFFTKKGPYNILEEPEKSNWSTQKKVGEVFKKILKNLKEISSQFYEKSKPSFREESNYTRWRLLQKVQQWWVSLACISQSQKSSSMPILICARYSLLRLFRPIFKESESYIFLGWFLFYADQFLKNWQLKFPRHGYSNRLFH